MLLLGTTLLKGVLTVTSPSFKEGGTIPSKFTCEGENINPALHIEGIPAGTKFLALLMDDPDAPDGTFDHWVIWNVTPSSEIPEHYNQGIEGNNGTGKTGYTGPCPPSGNHRYYFKVYALDTKLELKKGASKQTVEKTMEGHVLASGELMGTYQKTGTKK